MRYLTVSIFVCLSVQINAFNSMIQYQGPCNFVDTINITGGHKNEDNSFTYQGVNYEYGTYGLYGYIIENQTEKINVPPHYRYVNLRITLKFSMFQKINIINCCK